MNKNTLYWLFACLIISISTSGCQEFLDVKPDKKLAIPQTLDDLQAILDRVATMNSGYPGLGESASDNYYLTYDTWSALPFVEYRKNYIWETTPSIKAHWISPYQVVFYSNTVLDALKTLTVPNDEKERSEEIKGRALFYRGYAFHQLAQVFAPAYSIENSGSALGIALRLTADINVASERASLEETYNRIFMDLKEAAILLPASRPAYPTQPGKAAAYAALSRTAISVGDYKAAGMYADSCLLFRDRLLDYNNVDTGRSYPFDPFNQEVIFFSRLQGGSILLPSRAKVDTMLFRTYLQNDLRKKLFFTKNKDGSWSFTGNYAASDGGAEFNGLTTAEMYLTRAECHARNGNESAALADLNHLVEKRMVKGTFEPLKGMTAEELFTKILEERRKELIFRGLRWIDLRRLNNDQRHAVALIRNLNGTLYKLEPSKIAEYAFQIPAEVIENSDMSQNE